MSLNKIGDVHGHLVDDGVVKCLNVFHDPHVVAGQQVDGHALPAESAAATNPGEEKE